MARTKLSEWLRWMESLHPKPMDLGLERVGAVGKNLGLLRPADITILVGGTNGKGSSVAFLEAMLGAAGYSVGAFTSPHLFHFRERFRIDGIEPDDDRIVKSLTQIDQARAELSLTYFEFATLAGLLMFRDSHVDAAVLEVGLGGRLDAVNIVEADGCLITNIGLDHQRWLGNTKAAIAKEKAGIARRGQPIVLAADEHSAPGLREMVEERGALVWQLGREYDLAEQGDGGWVISSPGGRYGPFSAPAMAGPFQRTNAAGAAALLLAMGLPGLGDAAIGQGLGSAHQQGRMQHHSLGGVQWIFDVAHNPMGAEALAAGLAGEASSRRTIACVAAMADKDFAGMVQPLLGRIDRWIVTRARTPRSADPGALAETLRSSGAASVQLAAHLEAALDAAAATSRPGDRVVVFGSFHTVGPALTYLRLDRKREGIIRAL